MSGPWSGFNNEPANFEYNATKYGNPYGKIDGVGCDGTKSGIDATKPEYSSPFIVGGDGYSFTDEPIQIASPSAPYSVIERYNDSNKNYRNDFPKTFPSALGGGSKRRKHRRSSRQRRSRRHRMRKTTQYGCSKNKSGGRKRTRHSTRKHKRRHGGALQLARRGGKKTRKTMRGGMSSEADYRMGRDTSQDQPYGNKAYSFGQGLDSMLGANESALATPPPFFPYDNCGKYARV